MADPRTLPLLGASDVTYLGKFNVNNLSGLNDSPHGLIAAEGNRGLYAGDGSKRPESIAVIEIPALGGTAKIVTPATPVQNIEAVSNDPNRKLVGGGLFWRGRVKLAAYAYYDGSGSASASHFDMAADLSDQRGPYRIGTWNPGLTAKYMAHVPAEWQPLLGGPAITGASALPIIGRSSLGPSAHVFDPDAVGGTNTLVPSTVLCAYPHDHPTLGTWEGVSQYFTGADTYGGAFFAPGTRSLVFVSSHGMAAQGCYGYGTLDPALVGTTAPDGVKYCLDGDGNKGPKAYPYVPYMTAYDANDLLDVKAGKVLPWDVKPYATWIFGTDSPMAGHPGMHIQGATFDPTTGRLYVSTGSTEVFVFKVNAGTAPPPPPPPDVDCVETAGAWGPWTPSANGTQETRSRIWTQTTAKSGNGKACTWTATRSPVTEMEVRDVTTPPPATLDCEVRGVSKYADGDLKLTVRVNSNGPAKIPVGFKFKVQP